MELHEFNFSDLNSSLSVGSQLRTSTVSNVFSIQDVPLTYDNFKKETIRIISSANPNTDIRRRPECICVYALRGDNIVRVITPARNDVLFCVVEQPPVNADSFPIFLRTPRKWKVAWGSPYICLLVRRSVVIKDILDAAGKMLAVAKLGVTHLSSERCIDREKSLEECGFSRPLLLDCDVVVPVMLKVVTGHGGKRDDKICKLSIGPIGVSQIKRIDNIKKLLRHEYDLKSKTEPLVIHKGGHVDDSTSLQKLSAINSQLPGDVPVELVVLSPPKHQSGVYVPVVITLKNSECDFVKELVEFDFVDPSSSVSELKSIVERKLGILESEHRLSINSTPLDENKLVSAYISAGTNTALIKVLVEKASMVNVAVKTQDNKVYDFNVNSFTEIYQLKCHIGKALRVPLSRQILKKGNEELLDSQIISNYLNMGRETELSVNLEIHKKRRIFKVKFTKQPFFNITVMDITKANVQQLKQSVSDKKGCHTSQLSIICLVSQRLLDDDSTPLAEYCSRGYIPIYVTLTPLQSDIDATFHVAKNGYTKRIESTTVNGKRFHADGSWPIDENYTNNPHSVKEEISTIQLIGNTDVANSLRELPGQLSYDGDNDSDVLQKCTGKVKEKKKASERTRNRSIVDVNASQSDSGFRSKEPVLHMRKARRRTNSDPPLEVKNKSVGTSCDSIEKPFDISTSKSETEDDFEFIENKDILDEATLSEVADGFGVSWKRTIRQLGVRETDMGRITAENPGDVYEQSYQALLKWKGEAGHDATRTCMRQALLATQKKDLADKLFPLVKADEIQFTEIQDDWLHVQMTKATEKEPSTQEPVQAAGNYVHIATMFTNTNLIIAIALVTTIVSILYTVSR